VSDIGTRVKRDGITAEAEPTGSPEYAESDSAGSWHLVTLRYGRQTWQVPVATSNPTAENVIEHLALVAGGFENASDFKTWAREYGFSSDARSAYCRYQQAGELAKGFRSFLGEKCDDYLDSV
jgi:hypothetical protein